MADGVYLDNSATTQLDPRVVQAMLPYLAGFCGNPSSLHGAGRRARAAVERAREQVAELLQATPGEIVFTGSGTESDNLALRGVMEQDGRAAGHLIASSIEHPAVLETCKYLERLGAEATYLPVDADGIVAPESLLAALRPESRLVSVMAANNVVGTLQPILELSRLAHEHGALFHTDAVQAAGKIPLEVGRLGLDLLSLSAHKFHGPQGVGALYVRSGVELSPIVFGGGQERGLRSATENVAGIVGFGQAAAIARQELNLEAARLVSLRDRIIDETYARVPGAYLIGHRYMRLPGHVCLGFSGFEGEAIKLLLSMDEAGVALSSGSACSAHHRGEPSHVLQAMGFDPVRTRGSLRITLGRFTTAEDVAKFLDLLPQVVASLRPMATNAISERS